MAAEVTTTSSLRLQLASGRTTLSPRAMQIVADMLRSAAVIDGVQGTVRIWPPMQTTRTPAAYVYPTEIVFPTVIHTCCHHRASRPYRVLSIVSECPTFSETLTDSINTGTLGTNIVTAVNIYLDGQDTLQSISCTPFQCMC